jgi:hypothetical protein
VCICVPSVRFGVAFRIAVRFDGVSCGNMEAVLATGRAVG